LEIRYELEDKEAKVREKEAFWLIIKRLRIPILAIVVTYAIASILLMGAEGVDAKGQAVHLSFFDAFYIISYTATTIGYGEIPYAFTYSQRMALIFTIYITVPAWFYAIGAIVHLFGDKVFQKTIKHIAFKKQIRALKEDFVVVCGYNTVSKMLIEKLQINAHFRIVLLEISEEKVGELYLEDYYPPIPALVDDATRSEILKDAGITSSKCKALVVLFDDDDINMKIAVKSKIINPQLTIVTESTYFAGIENLRDVGVDVVIDPFATIASRLDYLINTPHIFALIDWLNNSSLRVKRKDFFPRGKYIICSRGRFGKAIKETLLKNGIEYEIVDVNKAAKDKEGADKEILLKAGIMEADCVVVGTADDAVNLSIVLTARKMRPGIFTVVRENKMEDFSIFATLRVNKVFLIDKIIANHAYNIIERPLVNMFIKSLQGKSDAWGEHIVNLLIKTINKKPRAAELELNGEDFPAIAQELEHTKLAYKDIIAPQSTPGEAIKIVLLAILRQDGEFIISPPVESQIALGDKILIAGTQESIAEFETMLVNVNELYYRLNGQEKPHWLFDKSTHLFGGKYSIAK